MKPTKRDCFSPKTARFFINRWHRTHDFHYDFFQTPKGPLIFYKDSEGYHLCCRWNGLVFQSFETKELFLINLAEELAIAFGWSKNNENKSKTT